MSDESGQTQIYVALTSDEEWISAVMQFPEDRTKFRWRVIRRQYVLIEAGFYLAPGASLESRVRACVSEWEMDRSVFERAFHVTAREMGVQIPSYERRGRTPFNCSAAEFLPLVEEWALRVPAHLRGRDFLLFQRWPVANAVLLDQWLERQVRTIEWARGRGPKAT